MGDLRVVYVLEPVGRRLRCVTRTTRVMKFDAFSEVDFSRLSTLLNAPHKEALQAEDRPIVMGLMQLSRREGEYPFLDGEYGYEVLTKMLATGRAFFFHGRRLPLKLGEQAKGSLSWEALPQGKWRPAVVVAGDGSGFATNPPVCIHGDGVLCSVLELGVPGRLGMRWLEAGPMSEAEVAGFCLRAAKENPEVSFPVPGCVQLEDGAEAVRKRVLLSVQQRVVASKREQEEVWIDLRDRLRLRVRFAYGKGVVEWDAADKAVSFRDDEGIKRVPRDGAWEKRILGLIRSWGFEAESGASELGLFNFDSSVFSLGMGNSWRGVLEDTFAALDKGDWEVGFALGLRVDLAGEPDVYSDAHDLGDGWFSVDLGVRVEGRSVPLLPLLHRALRRERSRGMKGLMEWLGRESFAIRLDVEEGARTKFWLVSLPSELLRRIADHLYEILDARPFGADARARVNQWRLGELVAARLFEEGEQDGVSEIARLCERLGDGVDVKPRPAPRSMNARLRPYQEQGLGWLSVLGALAAGGVLADDMGLGKTLQAIAYMLDLKESGALAGGCLIVAPTSVVDNWQDELARFAPSLSVACHYGVDRMERWAEACAADVVLTSYAALWRDIDVLVTREWSLAALDEAQFIKNASSRTSLAARALRAERRLCLTGTPIENRLEDIWPLFDFVLPGFLGDEGTFRMRVARNLREEGESGFAEELRERLRKRLAPFVLRRRKEDVLADLPEKTEVELSVRMTQAQAEFYESYRKEASLGIRRELATGGLAGARVLILSRLLRLRQICCDPRLLEQGRETGLGEGDSAKLASLLELVEELLERGSRALVFSQFTSMLELIGEAFEERGWSYLKLTGDTRDRGDLVRRFQSGECPLFLVSLRAGGAGLNLTAADCVIHYDPWWNPAVERQATDRAHRIGQQKPVFVYKLIADESIEAKILHLQREKSALVEGLLSAGDVERIELDEGTLEYLLGE